MQLWGGPNISVLTGLPQNLTGGKVCWTKRLGGEMSLLNKLHFYSPGS
jgi:hypothetical protein